MNKKILILLLLLMSSFVLGDTLDYSLNTSYPDSEPYFIGTNVKEISISILDSSKNIIDSAYEYLDIKIGNESFKLYKKDKSYVSNKDFIISEDNVSSGNMIVRVDTRVEKVSNTMKAFTVKPVSDYLTYDLNVKDSYNLKQKIIFDFEVKFLKSSMSDLSCYFRSPILKDSSIGCEDNVCLRTIDMIAPETGNVYNYEIFCSSKYQNKIIPLYIKVPITVSNNLNIELVNPKDGVPTNPFNLKFKLTYPNGLPLESQNLSVSVDGKEKKVKYLSNSEYSINYFLFPFTTLDENITFGYNGNTYNETVNVGLKSALWFWVSLFVILIIVISNVLLLVFKVFKKEDVNDLIARRDLYMDKSRGLKDQYLAGQMTKTTYDGLKKDYQFKIATLNSKIIKLKKITPKEQLDDIEKTVKASIPKKKVESTPDYLLKALTKKDSNPKAQDGIPTIPSIEEKPKGDGFFTRIFKPKEKFNKEKTLEEKVEEVKKNIKKEAPKAKVSDDEFDISGWGR